jgi:branched-chain amino acid transport system ATP-binding protein
MLAIGRALIQRPRGLLIDEMTMGLSPLVSQQVAAAVRRAADELGIGVVVVEQRLDLALSIADRVVVLVRGSVRLNAPATEVKCDLGQIQRAYFGSTLSPRTV